MHNQIGVNQAHSWILTYPLSSLPIGCKGVQTAVLRILAAGETCHRNLEQELIKKLRICLGGLFDSVHFQPNWLNLIKVDFECSNVFLRMCWLKAIGGGWTTSIRMHESVALPCVFGCVDCKDEFRHYLICPILWQLAREALDMRETSFAVGDRLCLTSSNVDKLELLGYCHLLYHSLRKDSECYDRNCLVRSPEVVQRRANGSIRVLIPHIE